MNEELLHSILECINQITSKYGSSTDIARKIRSRARSIPAYSFTKGLVYSLVYIASRSSKDLVEIGLKAQKCEEIIVKIMEDKMSNEEKSYAIYGAILLYIAKKLNIVKGEGFDEIICDITRSPVAEIKMWSVLDWFKRFTEAYIHERE
ncbi:MAG: type III-B CRISPR module-associated protein Cmr5 [Desulfurococcaceae archaeon]|uniref:CRISPR type III-B/RAMP module-associated protein Cmr5 n=1 Tax=Staphylothermus marinus TaxID=2280 RepID=A0A7C4D9H3_STAMA